MHILKPDDVLLTKGYQSRGGQASLTLTVGYVCEADGTFVAEQDALAWLLPQFPDEPFDTGLKRLRGTYAVAGSACAPGGAAVAGLTVSVRVGPLQKQVLVQGERRWSRNALGWQPTPAQPFATMPIDLEHAYGARGWASNPYGRGHLGDGTKPEGLPLPNVEDPHAPMLSPTDVPPVATLGPLPQYSPERTRWLGAFDGAWQGRRAPWLPDDTDPRWFDCVPQDQCTESYWRGDEPWFVANMHPDRPEQSGHLPGLRPRLLVRTWSEPENRRELPLDLDTVWLFPNQSRVAVLYRAEMAVRFEDASDVLGAAIFTEHLADPPRDAAYYAEAWRRGLERPARPAEPAAAPDEAAATARAAAQAQAIDAQRAKILASFNAAQKAILDEAAPTLQAVGQESRLRAAFPPLAALPAAAPAASAAAPASAAAIRQKIDAAFKAMEASMQKELAPAGIDLNAMRARVKPQAEPEIDPLAILQALPIDPAKKAVHVERLKALMADMDKVKQEVEALQSKAKAIDAAAGQAPGTSVRPALTREELVARHQAKLSAAGVELAGLALCGLDLSGIDLSGAYIHDCDLRKTVLARAVLNDAQIENCELDTANLEQSRLARAQLTGCRMAGARLAGAQAAQARLEKCDLSGATLAGGQWPGTSAQDCGFEGADLTGLQAPQAAFDACRMARADATGAVLDWAYFDRCTLEAARFDQASLGSASLSACRAAGASFTKGRLQNLRTMDDTVLQGAHFDGADMSRASLQNTGLQQCSLRETRLDHALVLECDLSSSDAWHMVARRASFTGSRIAGATWRGANLMQAGFDRATLENLDLSGSNLHAASTRTATAQGIILDKALLTRCRLIEEHGA
ncbi:DUF2169 family type VI secretion system accessory protein [Candidimonas nitroreducens]|uniref:DUF2169 domain-containing protein n=1 Tax=Candidimonas nitroreducens TaxID=683354 RepID=A0A225MD56_9BURK|nr:DUF2169 domain-containing protein [Candidimonas nitroreducens]OWT59098.1 hypothetical protein CEY11_12990 [Candidimonas nitroreducens]